MVDCHADLTSLYGFYYPSASGFVVMRCGMGARIIVLAPVDGDPKVQGIALRPLIVTTVDGRGRIKEVLHIENHEAVCDLCDSLIALTRKELEERARGYVVIVDGRVVQIICETCRKKFWSVKMIDTRNGECALLC
jgi:hypothetical protein